MRKKIGTLEKLTTTFSVCVCLQKTVTVTSSMVFFYFKECPPHLSFAFKKRTNPQFQHEV